MNLDEAGYRLVLRLFPATFRHRYGAAMLEQFRRQRRAVRGRPLALSILWARTVADAARHGLGLRLEILRSAGLPVWRRRADFQRDIRHSLRALARTPGITVAVVSLALGSGASIALFNAVNGSVLRRLPVEDPETLVRFRAVGPNQMTTGSREYGPLRSESGQRVRATFSYPMFERLRTANQTMTDMIAGAPVGTVNVGGDGHAEIASPTHQWTRSLVPC